MRQPTGRTQGACLGSAGAGVFRYRVLATSRQRRSLRGPIFLLNLQGPRHLSEAKKQQVEYLNGTIGEALVFD